MSNNIIKFFKGFAVGNFPISKQAERAVFEQNVESLFAAGTDLMQIASDSNYMPNPQYGHLVLWQDGNNEQHAGIVIANREVYSITQQCKLAEIPAGAKGWDGLKELLKTQNSNTNTQENLTGFYIKKMIDGDGEASSHQTDMFGVLQLITNDIISIDTLSGKVSISIEVPQPINNGTQLVRSLIKGFRKSNDLNSYQFHCSILYRHPNKNSPINVTLAANSNAFTSPENDLTASNGVGCGASIYIRKKYRSGAPQVLAHELVHAIRIMLGRRKVFLSAGTTNQEEIEVMSAENTIASQIGGTQRTLPAGTAPQDLTFWSDFTPL